jgi:hypothetical protein
MVCKRILVNGFSVDNEGHRCPTGNIGRHSAQLYRVTAFPNWLRTVRKPNGQLQRVSEKGVEREKTVCIKL